MRLILLVATVGLSAAHSVVLPESFDRYAPIKHGISWKPCNGAVECGRFEVPLDYKDKRAGKASLVVARYRATKPDSRIGTLFLNPGGPGQSGVDYIFDNAEGIMEIVGGKYDIVSWDPRGVGYARPRNLGPTYPHADCFDNALEEDKFWENTIPRAGLEARGNFTSRADLKAFFDQADNVDHLLKKLGKKCVSYDPNTLQYVGTAAAARDMLALNDYLEGTDAPVHYWGFSYGTAIGIYFINMFPGRVGRMVLDGVVDPVYWANRPAHEIWSINAESTDEALEGFVTACAKAGPKHCAFAWKGSEPGDLLVRIRKLLNAAYDFKKELGGEAPFGSAHIRKNIYSGMYVPTRWPNLAEELQSCWEYLNEYPMSTQKKCFGSLHYSSHNEAATKVAPAPDYSVQAVTCGDAVDIGGVTTRQVFQELVDVTRNVSSMFGPVWAIGGLYCHRWPTRAVERYTGPWKPKNKQLPNKVLIIGNQADPITPLKSAKSVAATLGDSNAILIEQLNFGHTSFAMHSKCTLHLLKRYFADGVYPKPGKVCGTDDEIFSGVPMNMLAGLVSSYRSSSSYPGRSPAGPEPRSHPWSMTFGPLAFAVGLLLTSFAVSQLIKRYRNRPPFCSSITDKMADKEVGYVVSGEKDREASWRNTFNT